MARVGSVVVRKKAIWSLRLRLLSGVTTRASKERSLGARFFGRAVRAFGPGFVPGASPQAGIGRASGPLSLVGSLVLWGVGDCGELGDWGLVKV